MGVASADWEGYRECTQMQTQGLSVHCIRPEGMPPAIGEPYIDDQGFECQKYADGAIWCGGYTNKLSLDKRIAALEAQVKELIEKEKEWDYIEFDNIPDDAYLRVTPEGFRWFQLKEICVPEPSP